MQRYLTGATVVAAALGIVSVFAVSTAAVAKTPDRPTTLEELIKRGMAALKAGDVTAYIKLLVTAKDARKYCPERFKKRSPEKLVEKLHRKTRANVKACSELIDWSKAVQVSKKEGKLGKMVKDCGGKIQEVKDFYFTFAVGRTKFGVKLDEPVILGGKNFVFADEPRCWRVVNTPAK